MRPLLAYLCLLTKMLVHQLIDLITDLFVLFVKIIGSYVESMVNWFVSSPKKDIRNQVILITGSGHGLGREMAVMFGRLGAKLALIDINQVSLSQSVLQGLDDFLFPKPF